MRFRGDVNPVQELIEVRRLVQRVHDIRITCAFGFHALKSGDVDAMQENPSMAGSARRAAAGDFETSARKHRRCGTGSGKLSGTP